MPARIAAGLLALALAAACGWQTGLVVPDGARSVGVVYFDNTTNEPDVELELSQELGRAMLQMLDAAVVPPDAADLVVRGTLTTFRRRPGIRSRDNLLLETGLRVEARATLEDRVTGEVLARADSGVWSGFAVDDPRNEDAARSRALRYVADELILELFSGDR